jgi:beta-mannanase
MDDLFNLQLVHIWNNKNVPMITWEPNLCSGTPNDIEVKIASGAYDAYINTWSARLKTYLSGPDGIYNTSDDRRAYLRFGHEMNGNWYAWSAAAGNNSPNDYKAMWIRVRGIFTSKGLDASHVQWVWCVNNTDNGGFTAEQFYPGNEYVDWVAIDGYNWGTTQTWSSWLTPAQTYDNMLGRLKLLTTKPVALTEFASTTSSQGVSGKSQWITSAFQYAENNNIRLVTWFNTDKETDWAIFGGVNGDETINRKKAYSAYRTAIGSAKYITSDPANARLITDSQFTGQ